MLHSLRNIIVTANTSLSYNMPGYSPNTQQQQQQQKYPGTPGCGTGAPEPGVQHSSHSNFHVIKVRTMFLGIALIKKRIRRLFSK